MDLLNDYGKSFNTATELLPDALKNPIKKFSKENKLERGVIPMLALVVISIGILVQYGLQILMTIFTGVYPCYKSILAIEDKNDDEAKKGWLAFWAISALVQAWDATFGRIFSVIIPFYWFFRLLFFFYLIMPQSNGALTIYYAVFDHQIKANKDYFDRIQDIINDRF